MVIQCQWYGEPCAYEPAQGGDWLLQHLGEIVAGHADHALAFPEGSETVISEAPTIDEQATEPCRFFCSILP